jgi:hypothetical protein
MNEYVILGAVWNRFIYSMPLCFISCRMMDRTVVRLAAGDARFVRRDHVLDVDERILAARQLKLFQSLYKVHISA